MHGVRWRAGVVIITALVGGTFPLLAGPRVHVAAAGATPWGWGWDNAGQVGDGTYGGNDVAPVAVQGGLTGIVSLSAGGEHSLAALSDGSAWAWGTDQEDELGTGPYTNQPLSDVPVQVPDVSNVVAVAAGFYHSLALESNGTVWGWGGDENYEVAQPAQYAVAYPVQVAEVSNVTAISAGLGYSLALESDGTVWEWGTGLAPGAQTPVQVSGLSNVTAIFAGYAQAFAVVSDGSLWAWGSNADGQLGVGDQTDRSVPTQVSGLSNVVWAAGGEAHSLAVTADGTAWSWGNNSEGALGNGTLATAGCACTTTPAPVPGISGVTRVAAGMDNSLALTSAGAVWGWGRNSEGEVGNGSSQGPVLSPVELWAITGTVLISTSNHHCLAVGLAGGPPSAPEDLAASPGTTVGAIDLSWRAPSSQGGAPIQAYVIYRGTSSGTESALTVLPPWATQYTDTATQPLTGYYYVVAATNGSVGPMSGQACAVAFPWSSALGCSVP